MDVTNAPECYDTSNSQNSSGYGNCTDTDGNVETSDIAENLQEVDKVHVIVYLVIGSVGIIGNGFTLIILCSSPRIRNKTVNIFLISQSLLDFLCAVVLIGTAWQVVWGQEGGHFEILVWHKTSFRKCHAIAMTTCAWVFGIVFTLARMIPTTMITPEGNCIQNMVWPNQFWFSFVSILVCCLYLIFPVILISLLYLSIFIKLRKTVANGPTASNSNNQNHKLSAASINVLKTLIFLTFLYFLCWIWNPSFFLLVTLGVPLSFTSPFYSFSVFMTNINCCVNPFCYALQYREFQMQVKQLFCKNKKGNKTLNSESTTGTSTTEMTM